MKDLQEIVDDMIKKGVIEDKREYAVSDLMNMYELDYANGRLLYHLVQKHFKPQDVRMPKRVDYTVDNRDIGTTWFWINKMEYIEVDTKDFIKMLVENNEDFTEELYALIVDLFD